MLFTDYLHGYGFISKDLIHYSLTLRTFTVDKTFYQFDEHYIAVFHIFLLQFCKYYYTQTAKINICYIKVNIQYDKRMYYI